MSPKMIVAELASTRFNVIQKTVVSALHYSDLIFTSASKQQRTYVVGICRKLRETLTCAFGHDTTSIFGNSHISYLLLFLSFIGNEHASSHAM